MSSDPDVYPMPLFVRLLVSDVEASASWYRALGFDVVYELPVMAHVRYRRYADVMLATVPTRPDREAPADDLGRSTDDRGRGVSIYLTVEHESVDDVAGRVESHGLGQADGPSETGWNTREVVLVDPDGYELVFSEPVDTDRSFEDVMGAR